MDSKTYCLENGGEMYGNDKCRISHSQWEYSHEDCERVGGTLYRDGSSCPVCKDVLYGCEFTFSNNG